MNPDTGGSPAAEEIQTELKLLNQSMINKVKDIVNNNEPTADLWPQLRKANAEYLKSREELVEKMQNPKPEPNGEYLLKKIKSKKIRRHSLTLPRHRHTA